MKPQNLSKTLKAALTITASIAATLAPLTMAGAASAAATSCADVLIIGARGSGQSYEGNAGMGPQAYEIAQAIQGANSGRNVKLEGLQYEAASTTDLITNPVAYFASLETGAKKLQTLLSENAKSCPKQTIALIGYSQGAMAVHRAVLDTAKTSSSDLAKVAAVVLIADGDKSPKDKIINLGTGRKGTGVAVQDPQGSGARTGTWPASLRKTTWSICEVGDVVCDYKASLHGTPAGFLEGGRIHSNSYKQTPAMKKAGTAAGAAVSSRK